MSRVRGKDTKPELLIRKGMHAAGLRYRLHDRRLPGTPDLVFPGSRSVIFVHGCFWHGHDCPLFRLPATRTEFWATKIAANQARDIRAVADLRAMGWRVLTIWECAVRGPARRPPLGVTNEAVEFIRGSAEELEIDGDWRTMA